jgi:hypothetical protein
MPTVPARCRPRDYDVIYGIMRYRLGRRATAEAAAMDRRGRLPRALHERRP